MINTPDEEGNIIPDFSHAGYMGGGVALPDVPAVKELSPGARGCDRKRLQAALDEIGRMEPDENGFRGALLLRAGEYRAAGPLNISKSGVVLRGEGQFEEGTVIINTLRRERGAWSPEFQKNHNIIHIGDPEDYRPPLSFLRRGGAETKISGRVPVGSTRIPVKSSAGFRPGDGIVIHVHPNQKWADALGLGDTWTKDPEVKGGVLRWIYHQFERKVTGIDGNVLEIDIPMVYHVEPDLFRTLSIWNHTADPRISRSGVENIRLVSLYDEKDYAARRGGSNVANGVVINRAKDCWVRNVTALHFQFSAVSVLSSASNITVQDCAGLRPVSYLNRGSDRYTFFVGGSSTLVQRCYAREARHPFSSSARTAGPNVFLDCASDKNYADTGPHMWWDAGFLYDNVHAPGGSINVQNWGDNGLTHGWRGANHVLWNCRADQIICDAPRTGDTNWSIGSVASKRSGRGREKFGRWVSHGSHVEPRSLYLHQLGERLGEEAVRETTMDIQRRAGGREIFRYLKNKFSELAGREKDEDDNLILDPEFRVAGAQFWVTTGSMENPIDFDEYAGPVVPVFTFSKNGLDLERTENPVYGDDSAVIVPRDRCLRAMPFLFLNSNLPTREKILLNLSFDYKMEKGDSFDVYLIQNTIRTGTDEEGFGLHTWGKNRWERTAVFIGPPAEGRGKWQRYGFNLVLLPEFYEDTGMPYPTALALKFSPGSDYAIANPSLKVASLDNKAVCAEAKNPGKEK